MKLSTVLAIALTTVSTISVLANPASAETIKNSEVYSCQVGSYAVKISNREFFCRTKFFSVNLPNDTGLKSEIVHICFNRNVRILKNTPSPYPQSAKNLFEDVSNVKCEQ
jgi:hypothetical protein